MIVLTMNTHCISVILGGAVCQKNLDHVPIAHVPVTRVPEIIVTEIWMLGIIDRGTIHREVTRTTVKSHIRTRTLHNSQTDSNVLGRSAAHAQ